MRNIMRFFSILYVVYFDQQMGASIQFKIFIVPKYTKYSKGTLNSQPAYMLGKEVI